MTFTTVGLPYFSARVKKIVPTADPANPENNTYPKVLAWILRISSKRDTRSGRNMIRISTCSQKTITLASNSALSGMRHALSVPQSAAPRPTSHGPYVAPVELGLSIPKRLPSTVCRVNAHDSFSATKAKQLLPIALPRMCDYSKRGQNREQEKDQRCIDATTNSMLINSFTLCVAPSAGLVMTKSSIPVSRGIVRASAAAANVLSANIALPPMRKSSDQTCA